MFILVEAVAALGWTRVFAAWWQAWVGVSGLVGCCFGINVVGVLLCNVRHPLSHFLPLGFEAENLGLAVCVGR